MADVAVREPAWLGGAPGARRVPSGQLELPSFKGHTGSEFTDLGDFSLAAFEPAARRAAGRARLRAGAERAASTHPSCRRSTAAATAATARRSRASRHAARRGRRAAPRARRAAPRLGRRARGRRRVRRGQRARDGGGAFVYVAAGVHVELPIVLAAVNDAAGQRAAPPHARRARGGRPGRGLGAVSVGLRRGDGRQRGHRARRRPERAPALRLRAGPVRAPDLFGTQRAVVARDGSLDWVTLGFGRATGRSSW